MSKTFGDRLKHAWNAFTNPEPKGPVDYGYSSSIRPDRVKLNYGNERSIVSSIYTRIAIDVASVGINHVRIDDNGRYSEIMDSGLQRCLTLEANIDQTGKAFIQDVAMTLFDEGVAAIVPVDTTLNPKLSGSYDIKTMRVGKVIQWYPRHVLVSVYNDRTGRRQEVRLPKDTVAIIENPLYPVMNERNSTLRRLIRKLNLLDSNDDRMSSGKLDIIIQLPYAIKSDVRRQKAEERRRDIEAQLTNSSHGIAYIDSTERVTQLNRPAENNLLEQITYLTNTLYSQLGLTESIFNGTANEAEMINYHNRTIEPILDAIVDGMKRTFLTQTAITQGQSIEYMRDPFKLVPVSQLADIADKFTRNEILSSNEIRAIIGYKPSTDPAADELRNKNLNEKKQDDDPEDERQNGISEEDDIEDE